MTPEHSPSGSGLQAQPGTLAEWLTAQLDREDALARAATCGPWRHDDEHGDLGPTATPAWCVSPADPVTGAWLSDVAWMTGRNEENDAAHIAYWDPARVLADIAAKRAILAVVEAWQHATCEDSWYSCGATYGTDDDDACCDERYAGECTCGRDHRADQLLKPLAQPYRDQPGFDPAWVIS